MSSSETHELANEEDRIRFIFCLAVTLASCCEYDIRDTEGEVNDPYLVTEGEKYIPDDDDESDEEVKISIGNSSDILKEQEGKKEKSSNKDDKKDIKNEQSQDQEEEYDSTDENKKKSLFSIYWRKRMSEKERKQRHRKRRHEIASKLLLSSSDFLFLDQYEAEKFLPMLDTILSPPIEEGESCAKYSSNDDAKEGSDYWELVGNELVQDQVMENFLQELAPGAGLKCMVLLMFQYLLSCKNGYDSRIRHSLKKLGVAVFVHSKNNTIEDKRDVNTDYGKQVLRATKRYESLERMIAARLLYLAANDKTTFGKDGNGNKDGGKGTKERIIRGLQIGTMGAAAGTLLFVTGGLAAPAIATGLSAGLSASLSAVGLSAYIGVTAGFLTFMSSSAAVSIFGTAGGSLAMYKMGRRTEGLTEFSILHEVNKNNKGADLHRTICISGWLNDKFDFERPWGVNPSNPPLSNKQEMLERFYAIHNPDLVLHSKRILKDYNGTEDQLWDELKAKYKTNPGNLFPLHYGPRHDGVLDGEEEKILDSVVLEVCSRHSEKSKAVAANAERKSTNRVSKWLHKGKKDDNAKQIRKLQVDTSKHSTSGRSISEINVPPPSKSLPMSEFELILYENDQTESINKSDNPNHLSTVWDFSANYGGELYIVKWESVLILDLSKSVQKIMYDLAESAGKEVLKQTVFASLLYAAALPLTIFKQIDSIDGEWVLIMQRSKEAGKELAKSLLTSTGSGHRPVTLVGYSFGALVIYSCLLELAQYQEEWMQNRDIITKEVKRLKKKVFKSSPSPESEGTEHDKTEESRIQHELECEPASLIEDVVLMGMPKYLNLAKWKKCREIVSGRLVNVYCRNDKILTLLYRYKNIMGSLKPICGTCTVAVRGVENVDATHFINGTHADYCLFAGDILKHIRFGQPLRSNWNAVDEMSLLAEAEKKIEDYN